MRCAEAERKHPDYGKAVEAEMAEIRRGNYNFKGIGYDGGKADGKQGRN